MPVSFGIPLGLVIFGVGAILFFATNFKRTALGLIVAGVIITILTAILILLAVNSQM